MIYIKLICFVILVNLFLVSTIDNFDYIDLPQTHLPYYFSEFPNVANECNKSNACLYKDWLSLNEIDRSKCWGYEEHCTLENAFSPAICPGDKPVWLKTKEEQLNQFYSQADFGYIRQQINEMSVICAPLYQNDSALECSKYLRSCRARNILIDFTNISIKPERYKTDILKFGEIGGYCSLNRELLGQHLEHMSALQSWAPELRNFVNLSERPEENDSCDMIFERPTYIVKIDSTYNMYHHFCDFFNLYASLHLNMTHQKAFSRDNHIIIWETYEYQSPFSIAYSAFTQHQVINIRRLKGRKVCFKKLMLPLLPRMIFGLYYNTPIISGCEKSGLAKAFSEFLLHRLQIPLHEQTNNKLRITFLSRQTKYRRILNENELVNTLERNQNYSIRHVNFDRNMKFIDQLEISRNTDILIGIHGAGLTHLLFLPDWATIFELYHCEDPACYNDLARIRGVNYITWEDKSKVFPEDEGHHPDGGSHAKFTNYRFDVVEFLRLVTRAAENVYNNEIYKNIIENINNHSNHSEL